ncbi:MAG: hypothetical protein NTZ05_08450 [Chloroflexi bacterium]|nr:hypothetical protein [Chloroflexota bacterium]
MMRPGKVTRVLAGDMVEIDGGAAVTDPIGDEMRQFNEELVQGRDIEWRPIGHIHYDNISIICEVYLDGKWINQRLRFWLNDKLPTFFGEKEFNRNLGAPQST